MYVFRVSLSVRVCVCVSFRFGFEDRNSIVLIPDHYLSVYFPVSFQKLMGHVSYVRLDRLLTSFCPF